MDTVPLETGGGDRQVYQSQETNHHQQKVPPPAKNQTTPKTTIPSPHLLDKKDQNKAKSRIESGTFNEYDESALEVYFCEEGGR